MYYPSHKTQIFQCGALHIFPTLVVTILLCLFTNFAQADVSIQIDNAHPKWTISEYLTGLHIVYCSAPDVIFKDGKFAAWVKQSDIKTARFPGGTVVKTWDWRNPTGDFRSDVWSKKWKQSDQINPSLWMSLGEYLAFAKQSGITPLVGVDDLDGYKHNRVEESVKRAADEVRYVDQHGFSGCFWYIGNEENGHYKGGNKTYAKNFAKHAVAMKAVDPKIKIFWNQNNARPKQIAAFLAHDHGTSDGLETHGKWPYGGKVGHKKKHSFQEWMTENPLIAHSARAPWRDIANKCRAAAARDGRKNYLIADNEYGLGKPPSRTGFDRYKEGIVLADILQEHFIGRWDMACYWDLVIKQEGNPFKKKQADDFPADMSGRSLLSPDNNYRMNPFHFAMQLLGEAGGGKMLIVKTSDKRVHGFASLKDGKILLYLINKYEKTNPVSVTLTVGKVASATAKAMTDSKDGWGQLVPLTVTVGQKTTVTLPPLSYSRITITSTSK